MSNYKYRIWSLEHKLWWISNKYGYTYNIDSAGLYDIYEANHICLNANHHSDVNETMVPVEED